MLFEDHSILSSNENLGDVFGGRIDSPLFNIVEGITIRNVFGLVFLRDCKFCRLGVQVDVYIFIHTCSDNQRFKVKPFISLPVSRFYLNVWLFTIIPITDSWVVILVGVHWSVRIKLFLELRQSNRIYAPA